MLYNYDIADIVPIHTIGHSIYNIIVVTVSVLWMTGVMFILISCAVYRQYLITYNILCVYHTEINP